MSISSFVRIITVAAVIGCFMPVSAQAEDKGVQATLDATPEAVHKAAADALAVIGCEIKKDEPTHLEGVRTRKVGVFVGSGVGRTGARGDDYQREQRRKYAACLPHGGAPRALCPRDVSALRGSLRETQREWRVLAILALARRAPPAPLIS